MFNNYQKISYDFDGTKKTIISFNIDFDFSAIESSFYTEKINDSELIDSFSLRVFDDYSNYYIPLYTGEILNPFIELPPSTEQIENEFGIFKSLFSNSANFTATGGQTAARIEPGDLIVDLDVSYKASFDTTNNFAYISEVDYEINKLKILNKGMTSSSGYRILRKTNNKWNAITEPLLTGFVLNNIQLENYSNSPTSFTNEYEIITKSFSTAGYTGGTPTGGYISISEISDFIGNKNMINIPIISQLKTVGDMINVGS